MNGREFNQQYVGAKMAFSMSPPGVTVVKSPPRIGFGRPHYEFLMSDSDLSCNRCAYASGDTLLPGTMPAYEFTSDQLAD